MAQVLTSPGAAVPGVAPSSWPRRRRRPRPWAALVTALVTWAVAAATVVVALTVPAATEDALGVVTVLFFVTGMSGLALAGAVLAHQQPHATMARLLLATALAGVLARASLALALVGRDSGVADLLGWATNWCWVPAQALGLYLLLRFPTGALPSPRWRWAERAVTGWAVLTALVTALVPGPLGAQALAPRVNPIGIGAWQDVLDEVLSVLFLVMPLLVVLAVAAPVLRWRTAPAEERRQLAWVAGAAVLIAVTAPLAVVSEAGALLEGLAFLVLPGAIAVAVLRHRLWDVDLRRRFDRFRDVREEERHRLRRELHDSLGPVLGAVTLRVEAARNLLDSGTAAADLDGLLASIGADAEAAMVDVRRLIDELGPLALEDQDLPSALRTHLRSYVDGPRIGLSAPAELPELETTAELAAYRIACEAVRNAVRHARAASCEVTLAVVGDDLVLRVADDGIGLRGRPAGVGRQGMQRRAAELGGTLTVTDVPTGGTAVEALLPGAVR